MPPGIAWQGPVSLSSPGPKSASFARSQQLLAAARNPERIGVCWSCGFWLEGFDGFDWLEVIPSQRNSVQGAGCKSMWLGLGHGGGARHERRSIDVVVEAPKCAACVLRLSIGCASCKLCVGTGQWAGRSPSPTGI